MEECHDVLQAGRGRQAKAGRAALFTPSCTAVHISVPCTAVLYNRHYTYHSTHIKVYTVEAKAGKVTLFTLCTVLQCITVQCTLNYTV